MTSRILLSPLFQSVAPGNLGKPELGNLPIRTRVALPKMPSIKHQAEPLIGIVEASSVKDEDEKVDLTLEDFDNEGDGISAALQVWALGCFCLKCHISLLQSLLSMRWWIELEAVYGMALDCLIAIIVDWTRNPIFFVESTVTRSREVERPGRHMTITQWLINKKTTDICKTSSEARSPAFQEVLSREQLLMQDRRASHGMASTNNSLPNWISGSASPKEKGPRPGEYAVDHGYGSDTPLGDFVESQRAIWQAIKGKNHAVDTASKQGFLAIPQNT